MRTAYTYLFLFLSLFASVGVKPVLAIEPDVNQIFEQGLQAYQAKDYPLARQTFEPLAEAGHIKAQIYMGGLYDKGLGVERDPTQAMYWFERSAEQGGVKLQHDLGVRYLHGRDVDRDYQKAIYWWRKAVEVGFPQSQYNLGLMYTRGHGVDVDQDKAIALYQLAARQGLREAQYVLGLAYAVGGQGVPLDFNKAHSLFEQAAKQGYASAQYNLGVLTESGNGTTADINKALGWYRKAAGQGSDLAQQRLAQLESQFGNLENKFLLMDTEHKQSEQPNSSGVARIYDQAWVKSQPASHYTIQISTSHNEENLVRWLKSQQPLAPLAYFSQRQNGNLVYKAIYGSFSHQAMAQKALSDMPQGLVKLKPWVRKFLSVHGQLFED